MEPKQVTINVEWKDLFNQLEIIAAVSGDIFRESLKRFELGQPVEGVNMVCKIPPEMKQMSFKLPGTDRISNFKVYEFCNGSSLLRIHPTVIIALQAVRDALSAEIGRPICIGVSSGFRSEADQYRLAVTEGLGWADQGGRVARDSMHKYGVAVDFFAYDWKTRKRVDKHLVAKYARIYFDYVQIYAATGHVHGDQRYKSGIKPKD